MTGKNRLLPWLCSTTMSNIDRVRILVLGDSGVGKTSLVHLIANGQPLSHITYTIGASIEVKLHEYREGTPAQKTFWIELCDIGGSHGHRNSRHVFYKDYQGLILVHDLTNRKSQQNLEKWLREIVQFCNFSLTSNVKLIGIGMMLSQEMMQILMSMCPYLLLEPSRTWSRAASPLCLFINVALTLLRIMSLKKSM